MGEMAQRISKVDKEELLKILNCAFAEEWLAYYQRIIQLGGTPILDPSEWKEKAQCKYDAPMNADTKVLVAQNLTAERCAVARYEQICEMCQGKDFETFRISRKILKEELEHEQEMEDFEADFKYYK